MLPLSWKEEAGVRKLHVHYPDEPETDYDISPQVYKTPDGYQALYDVGMGLCWDAYTEEEMESEGITPKGRHSV